jgi:hypothetical protein
MRPLTTAALLLALLTVAFASDSTRIPRLVNTVSTRTVEFKAVQVNGEKSIDLACEHVSMPEALNTPSPVIGQGNVITVDFLVGWDGQIYSPFILESTTGRGDRAVLQSFHTWRFRPAMCNGVPVSAEGRITFRQ